MKFDYTKNEPARYMVSVYRWSVSDQYYFHSFKEAKAMFDNLRKKEHEKDTVLSIYDIVKDIRKEFARV